MLFELANGDAIPCRNDGTQAGYDTWRAHIGQAAGEGAASQAAQVRLGWRTYRHFREPIAIVLVFLDCPVCWQTFVSASQGALRVLRPLSAAAGIWLRSEPGDGILIAQDRSAGSDPGCRHHDTFLRSNQAMRLRGRVGATMGQQCQGEFYQRSCC